MSTVSALLCLQTGSEVSDKQQPSKIELVLLDLTKLQQRGFLKYFWLNVTSLHLVWYVLCLH